MSSAGGHGFSNERDTYEPEIQGMRNIAAKDGYDAGDGYTHIQPQLPTASGQSQSSYLPGSNSPGSGGGYGGPQRRSSTGGAYRDDYDRKNTYSYGDGDYDRVRSSSSRGGGGRGGQRGREYVPDNYSDSDEHSDFEDDRRGRGDRTVARRGGDDRDKKSDRDRSRSRIKQKLAGIFTGDENEMGTGNSESKKWAATMAGAVAGGFAGRTAKKDHWVPTALGAIIGGLAAREAEKMFFVNKDIKEQERNAYEGKRRSKSHER